MKHSQRLFLTLVFSTIVASAQTPGSNDKTAKPDPPKYNGRPIDTRPIETFYLANATQTNDGNEILTAIRLMVDPEVKTYLTPKQNAITVRALPEQLAQVRQILDEIDRPSGVFRLTYTIEESDTGKRVGIQHFAMLLANGQRTTIKDGSKIPFVTGSSQGQKNSSDTQITYLDVGLNLDSTVTDYAGGVRLQSRVEQSMLAPERSGAGDAGPIVRQAVLEGTSLLMLGKPQTLGSLDIPGSTRHFDIEAIVEQVR